MSLKLAINTVKEKKFKKIFDKIVSKQLKKIRCLMETFVLVPISLFYYIERSVCNVLQVVYKISKYEPIGNNRKDFKKTGSIELLNKKLNCN